jgi:uncharacterized protein (DUF2235 family)
MKRLVICCDGTWNRPDSTHITNIEKIARTVQTDPAQSGGVPQLVYYISGVGGAGYEADRILGGAFGFGLFGNVRAGYRFLAQNYDPGDEIFVVGFSRGAYTARSTVGMVNRVGLITKLALIDGRLPDAEALYQNDDTDPAETARFRRQYCHADTPVSFLGVFDTVGALGVPGAMFAAPRFHDVELGASVVCARQALAIDEPRLKFEPSLWRADRGPTQDTRVKQVWFEGAHSDVGGGYAKTGLSDTALLWMTTEATSQGLVLDRSLLDHYVASGSPAARHNPLKPLFTVDNTLIRAKMLVHLTKTDSFAGVQRRLDIPGGLSVRLASSALDHYHADPGNRPANLASYVETKPPVETVTALPAAPAGR